jgi:hypothetical protein
MHIYILGTITTAYNLINEEHIQKTRKRVFINISAAELDRLRLVWGHSYMPAVDGGARIIVNIYGRKNMQPLLDRYCRFSLKISKPAPGYDRKRLIFKDAEPVF